MRRLRFTPFLLSAWLAALSAAGTAGAQSAGSQSPVVLSPSRVITVPAEGARGDPPVVSGLDVTAGGDMIVAAGDDHLVRLWRGKDAGDRPLRVLTGHLDWVLTAAFHPQGKELATAGEDRAIIVWETDTGRKLRAIAWDTNSVYCVRYSTDGQWLAACGTGKKLRLYSAEGNVSAELDCPCNEMRTLAFSPDGKHLAAGGRTGEVSLWQLPDFQLVRKFKADTRRIRALAFSPDSALLATGGEGASVRVWNVNSGDEKTSLSSRPGKVYALAFCGQDLLAAGGTDDSIRVFNIPAKTEEFQLKGHRGSVTGLVWDGTNGVLVSGSYDTSVRFWTLKRGDNTAGAIANPTR
ncbi:MAG: WD40 repeat domain-containing protein [Planctomycetia bacterium]|nr:WD40 repeat domain-containing protein [Planctomycetia bacterium]